MCQLTAARLSRDESRSVSHDGTMDRNGVNEMK